MDSEKKISKIEIDRALCIGAASCIAVAPEVYYLDEEAKAVLKDPNGADSETILMSARSCPTKAILLYDEAGDLIDLD